MSKKAEITEAMEAAKAKVKTAKEQIKRLDKIAALITEIREGGTLGYEDMAAGLTCGEDFRRKMEIMMELSEANIKRYKKALALLDKLDALDV